MMISAQNNTARQNQKAQGQGLAAGYAREYIKFDSSGGGERSSFFLSGSQPESSLNHQPQNQTQATETREGRLARSFSLSFSLFIFHFSFWDVKIDVE
jgi:hypothetical protein